MDRLRAAGSWPIRDWVEAERPYLGICLGLQLLFEGSDEDGARTFGVMPGRTARLVGAPTSAHRLEPGRRRSHPAFDGIADGADFYFVHSYVGSRPQAPRRGGRDDGVRPAFVSAVARGDSSASSSIRSDPDDGLRLLANFVARSGRAAGRRRGARLMLRRRVIPCLDVADGRVVKGTVRRPGRRG